MRTASHPPRAPWGGITGRGGVSARSAPRFCNDGRIVAILPAQAHVGLLTDCKGSSDERRAADLSCRQRGIGAETADCRSDTGECASIRRIGSDVDERADRIAYEARQRVAIGDADLRRAFGLSCLLVCSPARATTRRAFGQDADVRIDHPAAVLEVADRDGQARRALHVGDDGLRESLNVARVGQADEAMVERCAERRRSLAGDRSSQPRSVYHRTYGATRGTEPHGLVRWRRGSGQAVSQRR